MKSTTRLDSAYFQLTPTRTRCDLVITANGKTEKIASGLLNPFVAHLKTAQDQIDKGGYSIILEPQRGSDATWFTKGTVERFVRFVSTPEVLERVFTIESEILQIEEAIAIQSKNDMGLSTVEDRQAKLTESIEGRKPSVTDFDEEKAIILYKPSAHLPEANGFTSREENSKIQLFRVLETRKSALQKEQGMAFARAVAAGFDIDHVAPLMSFAECFGASRLKDACLRFVDLWKEKHETGQWLEIEAAQDMSTRLDFSSMNASGIMLSNVANKPKEFREAWSEPHSGLVSENNGKASIDATADEKPPPDHQVPVGHQEYFQGHFPHHMYPPWPMHSPPGTVPVFQAYPVQGVPYYQNYPGNSPFFQSPYPSVEESRLNAGQRMGQKRHSMDSRDSNTGSETWEIDASKARLHDDLELEKEASLSQGSRKKANRLGKKQSGKVVIQNLNYITSKRRSSSGSESQSASDSETEEEDGGLQAGASQLKNKNYMRSTKRKGSHTKSVDTLNSFDKDTIYGKEADGGHWQAFQNCLLRDADEDKHTVDRGMFVVEKDLQLKRRQNAVGDDPLVFSGRDRVEIGEETPNFYNTGDVSCVRKSSNDEVLISRRDDHSGEGTGIQDGQKDVQFSEVGGSRAGYRRTGTDDFLIHGREDQAGITRRSSDPLAVNGFDHAKDGLDASSSNNITDESFIVPLRSISLYQVGTNDRNAIDMDAELPTALHKADNNRIGSRVNYEPNDLCFMPERGTEMGSVGYDPALDYEMQIHSSNAASVDNKNKQVEIDVKQESKKSDKGRRAKVIPGTSDKKKIVGPTQKGKPSKLSPLDEAKARAEKLRFFKADLQKEKKQKEEEEMKRLEALKIERQKRIAARGGPISTQSKLLSHQTRKQLPTKFSPSSQKGSKFSDSDPGSLSPLQRFSIGMGPNDSRRASKPRSNSASRSAGNRLSQSVPSLPESKKENTVTPESKASMARIRRLSEPKISSSHHVSLVKSRSAEPIVSKPKISGGTESKKISAIVNLDRTKAATLPELKIRKSKGPSDAVQKKSAAKETTSEDGDDNTVIEKTVVVLECEKPSIPVVHVSEDRMGEHKRHNGNHGREEKTEVVPEYAAIRAPLSPPSTDEVDRAAIKRQLQDQPSSYEITVGCTESLKSSSTTIAEKQYQAPYARVSSLEDPCTVKSEYGMAPPPTSLETVTTEEMLKARVTDFKNLKLDKIPEVLEKPQVKESSKGFRRLLKFGRKNNSSASGEHNIETDGVGVNGFEADDHANNTATSHEVHTLKNLISQDETPTASSTQKSSRHFSLLSPFRIKSSEKKLTT